MQNEKKTANIDLLRYFVDSGAISIQWCRFVDNIGWHNFNFFFHEGFVFEEDIVLGEETFHISNYRREWWLIFNVRETLGTAKKINGESSQKDKRTQMVANLLLRICIERAFLLVISQSSVVGV